VAAGKCVLASDVAGIRDQLQNFETHLFAPGDYEMLSAKLLDYLALDDTELEQLGSVFSNHITTNYTIEKEVRLHEEFYAKWI